MTLATSQLAACVTGYAARLHASIGNRHHVASPLGAWLLLALAGPASSGADRARLTDVLGCDVEDAAQAAADLLTVPDPLVASAAAVWTAQTAPLPDSFYRWRDDLPQAVQAGDLPGQAGLDDWAREHTFGLIDRFPVTITDDVYLVLASALATKVSWEVPFDLAPAASLGEQSPWVARLERVLRTPDRPGGHSQFVAATDQAGDVVVHVATAAGGLEVTSVAALPGVPFDQVLAAAYDLGCNHAVGAYIDAKDVASLPLGEHAQWSVREVMTGSDSCVAVLPAWSATSDHNLATPGLGFQAAKNALVPGQDPWQARQSAMARYSRTGFEAAAVSALAVAMSARLPAKHREVVLRFGHPYAVVAFTTDTAGAPAAWHGLPVFSAWVAKPENATENGAPVGRR
jgi:hypothetical protein